MVRGVPARRRSAAAERPVVQRQAGERFVERDEHSSDDFGDDFDDYSGEGVRVGMRVRHSKFGIGAVREVRMGGDPLVRVHFSGVGVKLIKLSFLIPA